MIPPRCRGRQSFVLAKRVSSSALLLLTASCVLRCGGSDAPPAERPAVGPAARKPPTAAQLAEQRRRVRERRCWALCMREQECGLPGSAECPSRCAADPRKDLDNVRIDFGWKLVACLEGVDCQSLVEGKAMEACAGYARQQLAPTDLLRTFCFESAARSVECGQPADQSDCLDRYRFLDDGSLADGLRCLEQPCARVPDCFRQAFGF